MPDPEHPAEATNDADVSPPDYRMGDPGALDRAAEEQRCKDAARKEIEAERAESVAMKRAEADRRNRAAMAAQRRSDPPPATPQADFDPETAAALARLRATEPTADKEAAIREAEAREAERRARRAAAATKATTETTEAEATDKPAPAERNERTRQRAESDPIAFLDHATGPGWPALSEAFNRWDWTRFLPSDGRSWNQEAERKAREANAPEWRVLDCHEVMHLQISTSDNKGVKRRLAARLIDHLAELTTPGEMGVSLLAKVVEAWPPPVPADNRRHQNLPGVLIRTQHVSRHEDDQQRLPFDETRAPPPPRHVPRFETAWLPGMEPAASGLPFMVLNMLDFGASRGRNGPVPVPQRVGWELILWSAPGAWHAEQATVMLTHDQLAGRVWPKTPYKRTKHGPLLYSAARWLNDPENAMWWRRNGTERPILLVTFFAPPFAPYDPEGKIGAHVILPDGGRRRGAQFDAHLRRVLAATSYRQHRVYVAAVCLWDSRATVKGYLVQLTVPEVCRNEAGYVLDTDGQVATEKGGRPSRRATHPRAVHTGNRLPNPAAATAYLWLEGDDVILVAHHQVAETTRLRNEQRRLTLETLAALSQPAKHRDKVLDFEARYQSEGVLTGVDLATLREQDKLPPPAELEAVRLLPSQSHFATHQARRENRQRVQKRSRR